MKSGTARSKRRASATCRRGRARTRRSSGAPQMQYERENGNTYREFELALPRELERDHQIALVQRFIESELGTAHAYQWAMHTAPRAMGANSRTCM